MRALKEELLFTQTFIDVAKGLLVVIFDERDVLLDRRLKHFIFIYNTKHSQLFQSQFNPFIVRF